MLDRIASLFDFRGSIEYLPDLLKAAVVSVELTLCVMAIGLVVGLIIALMRVSHSRILRVISTVYVEAIRGTPCLLQLFYIYFVLPAFGIRLDPFPAGVVGLAVNYSAYLSEVYRAGIMAVPRGQLEASQALGMSRRLMMRLIILPQAIRVVVPPLGNYFISLFKDTSLVSIISVADLSYVSLKIRSETYRILEVLSAMAAIYWLLGYPQAKLVDWLHRRYKVAE